MLFKRYLYRLNRGVYWRCIRCTKYQCKSKLILRQNQDPLCVGEHSHGPEDEKIDRGKEN